MSTSSQSAPRNNLMRFIVGFAIGLVLAFFVIRNWQDIKAGFLDGYAAGTKAVR